jgi:putative membrane protein
MMNHPYLVENGHRHADHPFGWLLMFVVLALVVALIVWIVLRVIGSRGSQAQSATAETAHDDALELVRMRYARGEIDREVFLRTTADLGGAPEPLAAPSAPPEPPAAPSPA